VTHGPRAAATVERTVSLTEETMFMRRRAAPRGAAVGNGAHAPGKKASRRPAGQAQDDAQDSDEQNERIATREQQAQHAPPGPSSGPSSGSAPPGDESPPSPPASRPPASRPVPKPTVLAELNRLSKLHREGALTDAEFAAAKAKLLT
jgi:Short C-terminal domain